MADHPTPKHISGDAFSARSPSLKCLNAPCQALLQGPFQVELVLPRVYKELLPCCTKEKRSLAYIGGPRAWEGADGMPPANSPPIPPPPPPPPPIGAPPPPPPPFAKLLCDVRTKFYLVRLSTSELTFGKHWS